MQGEIVGMVGRVALVVLSAALGVGIGFAGHQFGPPLPAGFRLGDAPPDPAPPGAAPTVEPSAAPAPTSSATAAASSSALSAVPTIDVQACTRALFPADAFPKDGAGVAFVCEEATLVKGAARMKEAVVNAGGGRTTDAMKEWAVLGFYELPVYAVARDACCPGAPALEIADSPEGCPSMKDALGAVVAASKPGSPEDQAETALKDYTKAVKCLVKNKADKAFGKYDPPSGGQQGTAKKTVDRARALAPAP